MVMGTHLEPSDKVSPTERDNIEDVDGNLTRLKILHNRLAVIKCQGRSIQVQSENISSMWTSSISGPSIIFAGACLNPCISSKALPTPNTGIRRICGDEVADKCKPLWGMDEEGEINGCWKLWAFLGWGISWVCCSSSAEKTRVPPFVLPDSLSSFFRPGDSCPSFFRGNSCPPFVFPGKS